MKKVFTWFIATILSTLLAFSATAAPLDGYDIMSAPVISINKNDVKQLVSAPKAAFCIAKSEDKAILNIKLSSTMKTSAVHVSMLAKCIPDMDDGSYIQYKPQKLMARWNKRPIPINNS